MRTKAGIACLAIATFALAGFAATGLGARLTGTSAIAMRPRAISVTAHIHTPAGKRSKKTPSVVYGSVLLSKKQALQIGTQTVALSGCPKGTKITNGSVAALHPKQAKNLTINGEGVEAINASKKVNAIFVDVTNNSDTVNPPGFSLNAIGSIVCVK